MLDDDDACDGGDYDGFLRDVGGDANQSSQFKEEEKGKSLLREFGGFVGLF